MKRLLRWVAVGVVAALVVAAGAVALAWSRYDPVTDANAGSCCSPPFSGNPASPFLATGLMNDGRFRIRVTGIDAPPGTHVRIAAESGMRDLSGDMEFRPFELGPGEDRWVVVAARAPGCAARQAARAQIRDVKVRFELFGLEKTATLDLEPEEGDRLVLADGCAWLERGRRYP